jgi:SAM-dependent methyltransferase
MAELSRLDPTGRFTGRAVAYAKYRPGYPAPALGYIVTTCGLGQGSLLVDVGCGTGISSRLFAAEGVNVVGIEPNADMRGAAQAMNLLPAAPSVTYREGRAECTGLPDAVADAVLAAQAFHWFEPEAALIEFHRLLKPAGWSILMWNERDGQDPFTAAYGVVVRTAREAAQENARDARAGSILLTSPLFRDGQHVWFRNDQALDEDGLLGRAFSVSYAPAIGSDEAAACAEDLRAIFREHQRDGNVVLRYHTSIYLARRAED